MPSSALIKSDKRLERWVAGATRMLKQAVIMNQFIAVALADGGSLGPRQIPGVIRYIHTNAPRYHRASSALKATPTNFYESAAQGIELQFTARVAGLIFVNGAPFIARAFKSSVIRPKDGKKWLTIPAIAEAYGKRAREFGDRLEFQPRGKKLGVLVWRTHPKREASDKPAGPTKATKAKTASKSKGSEPSADTERPVVVYWCVPAIKQKQDRSILPSNADIRGLSVIGARRAMIDQEARNSSTT